MDRLSTEYLHAPRMVAMGTSPERIARGRYTTGRPMTSGAKGGVFVPSAISGTTVRKRRAARLPYGEGEGAKEGFASAYDPRNSGVTAARMKASCDDYFWLPARREHRGVGGVFFDDCGAPWARDFALALLDAAVDADGPYLPIVNRTSSSNDDVCRVGMVKSCVMSPPRCLLTCIT